MTIAPAEFIHTKYEVKDHICVVTLNRPDRRNALNPRAYAEVEAAFVAATADDDVRCVVVTGADPSLVTVMFVLALWPTGTEPNVTDWVDAVSVPVTAGLLDETLPTFDVQPLRTRAHTTKPSKLICSCCDSLLARKGGRSTLQRRARVTI